MEGGEGPVLGKQGWQGRECIYYVGGEMGVKKTTAVLMSDQIRQLKVIFLLTSHFKVDD